MKGNTKMGKGKGKKYPRKINSLVVVLLGLIMVTACGDNAATPAPAPAQTNPTTAAAATTAAPAATTATAAMTTVTTTTSGAAASTAPATTAAVSTTAAASTSAATTAPIATTSAASPARMPTKPTAAQLKIAINADENTLTPFSYVTGYPGIPLLNLVYDSLYIFNPNFEPVPWLATGYTASADGKQFTITLRDNLKWQDGQPLVAEDVKATYELMQTAPGNPWASGVRNITAIDTPDTKTVVFTLKSPNPEFVLRPLADTPILPKHIWGSVKPEDAKKFDGKIGSGPYKLVDYQPGVLYRFQANATYWAGKPTVDELVVPIVKDNTTIFSSLRTGELDAATRAVPPELLKEFSANPQLQVQTGASFGTSLLQLNDSKAPFDQKDVRLAIAYAIDVNKLVSTVALGNALPGNPGFVHPASPYHNPNVKPIEFNPAKSKELLDQAGFAVGSDGIRVGKDGKPLDFKMLVYSDSPTRIRSAELIRDWLKNIGIKVTVVSQDPDSVDALVWPEFDVTKGRNYDMAMWSWSSSTQQSLSRIGSLYHSNTDLGSLNIGAFKSAAIDKLVEDLNATPDLASRLEAGQKLEAAVAGEMPFITLYYDNAAYASRPATYDGFVFHKLYGIIQKFSFLPATK